jgi:hypothetical protein
VTVATWARLAPADWAGAIDTDLLAQQPFYGTDFTKPLLFIEDGQYLLNLATADHLTGDNQLWHHVPGWRNSANVDLIAIYMTGAAS